MDLATYVATYPPVPPRRSVSNEDERRHLGEADGVRELAGPPAFASERNVPSRKGDTGCHLWVIQHTSIPYVCEYEQVVPPLQSGRVTHTNLTGGGAASFGGELWIDPIDDNHLYVNGCSGRYGPQTETQLNDAVVVLETRGYAVTSFGWDHDTAAPAMVLR